MTLLEVVVALTVAGAALAAGATVLGFLTDQQPRQGLNAIVSANTVRSTIRTWTTHARLTTDGDAEFRGAPAPKKLGEATDAERDTTEGELTFLTTSETDVAPAGTRIHLHMQRDSGNIRGLVAELTPFRTFGTPRTLSLVPNATGLQIRYLGSTFGRAVWQNSWISTSVLPAAIEIRIKFDSSVNNPTDPAARALLEVPMLIPLAARR